MKWNGAKYNIVDNYRQLVDWIAEDRIIVDPLRTHTASPADCQEIYTGLTTKRGEYLSAVFDWSRLEVRRKQLGTLGSHRVRTQPDRRGSCRVAHCARRAFQSLQRGIRNVPTTGNLG